MAMRRCGLEAPRILFRADRRNMKERQLRKSASRPTIAALIAAVGALAMAPAQACWDAAAARYGVSSELLYAIARTESALDPNAIGHNRNGTRDIGLMQINSAWLPTLAVYGIGERELFEPCTSIHIGAWVLAGNIQRLGYTWNAIGAYNAVDPELRRAYAARVHRQLQRAGTAQARTPPREPNGTLPHDDRRVPALAAQH